MGVYYLSTLKKIGICLILPIIILLTPVPNGLSPATWQLFAIYAGTIVGLVVRPYAEHVLMLGVVGICSIWFKNSALFLSGFSNSVTWLIFAAFMIGVAFSETGLGRRIAYMLIGKLGKSPLRLGYVIAATDLIISPATPSNTARSGGIIFPIITNLAATLKSEPGNTARRIGSYLIMTLNEVSLTTGTLFITAMAPNALMLSFAEKILKVHVDWFTWAKAALVPGLLILLLIPFVVYKLYPPELKEISNKEIAAAGLKEIGILSLKEKLLIVYFLLAVVGWATGNITKIDSTSIAIAFVVACLFTGVVKWDTLVRSISAWNTLIWYGGIIGISEALAKGKFFEWLARLMGENLVFSTENTVLVMGALLILSLVVRYLFASMGAFVATMIPVLYTIGNAYSLPAFPLTMLLATGAGYGSLLTHYGGGCCVLLFGPGFVDQGTWWKIGAIIVGLSFLIYMTVGLFYWRLIGLW